MPFQIEPQDENQVFDLLYSQRLRSGTDTINQNFRIFRSVTQGFRTSLDYLHFFSLIAGTSLSEIILNNLDKRILPFIYYILAPTLEEAENLKDSNNFTSVSLFQPSQPSKGDILFLFSIDSPSDFSVYICIDVQQQLNSVQYTWEELSSGIGGGGIKTLKSYEDFLKEYKKVKNAGRFFYLNFDTSSLPSSWTVPTQTDPYILEVIKLKDLIKRGDAVLFYYDEPIPQNPQNPIYLKIRVLNRLGESPVLNPDEDIPDTYNNVVSFEKGMNLEQMAMAIDEFAEKLAPAKPPVFTDRRIAVESTYGSVVSGYGYEPTQANGCTLLSNPNYSFDSFDNINNFPSPKKSLIIYSETNFRQNNYLFNFSIRLGSFHSNRYHGFEVDEKSSLFVRFFRQENNNNIIILKRHNFQIVTKDELLNIIFNRTNPGQINSTEPINFVADENNSEYNLNILSGVDLYRNIRDAYFQDNRSIYSPDSKSVRFWAQAVLYLNYLVQANQSNLSPYFIHHAVARTRVNLNQNFVSQRSIEIYFDYENVVSSDNVADFVFYIGRSQSNNPQAFITATNNNLSILNHSFISNASPVSFFYVSGLPYIDLGGNSFFVEIQRVKEVCGRYAIRRNFLDVLVYFSNLSTYNVTYNPSFYQKENSSYDIIQANPSSSYRENLSNNFNASRTSLWINTISLDPSIEAYYFYLYRKNLQLSNLNDQYRIVFSQNDQPLILYSSIIQTANTRETDSYNNNVRRIVDLYEYLNRLSSNSSVLFSSSDQTNSSFRQQNSLQLICYESQNNSRYLRYVYPFRVWNLAMSIQNDNYDYTNFNSHRFVGYRLKPLAAGSSSVFKFAFRHSLNSNDRASSNSTEFSNNFVVVVRPNGAHPDIDGNFFILASEGGNFQAPTSPQFTTNSVPISLTNYGVLSGTNIAIIEIAFGTPDNRRNMNFSSNTHFDIFVGFRKPSSYKSLDFNIPSNGLDYYPIYPY